ncbi:MAG TPA: disulfide bond formation protein DsbA [Alphaproteobacteria bacterium]|nr:disulfide bond formation protein DsbA [Alphaproteobacteria bacterium]HAJ47252.1 disulfide bond formation protein DsbA [Alphaproteobacteria bacterium]
MPSRTYLIAGLAALALLVGAGVYFYSGNSGSTIAAASAGAGCKPTGTFKLTDRDVLIGDPKAPVTFIEYVSLTCGHCAAFHTTVLPKIKEAYIDKGLVNYVVREFPLNNEALAASVLTRCVPRENFNAFVGLIFEQQGNWMRSQDLRGALKELSNRAGLGSDAFEACLASIPNADAVRKTAKEGESMYCIKGTPTAVLNGRVLETKAIANFEAFDEELRSEFKRLGKALPEPVMPAAAPAPAEPAAPVVGAEPGAPAQPATPAP